LAAKVMAIFDGKVFIESCDSSSDVVGLILDKTPCYAEQGGQIYDTATFSAKGVDFKCDDIQKYAGYVVHSGVVKSGKVKVGDAMSVQIDYTRRSLIAKNHTCTHILNYALRQVLGEKIDQKGSLVDEAKLRFDFSHHEQIKLEDLRKIEDIVNTEIQKNHAVNYKEVPLTAARAIGGLRAVFGEAYPDPVRVLSVGPEVPTMLADSKKLWGREYSVEFCGGTHVAHTEEIYRFVLQVEEGIAKGVRRIVGVTGPQAYSDAMLRVQTLTIKLDKAAKLKGGELDKMIADIRTEVNNDKEISLIEKKSMAATVEKLNDGQKAAGKAATKEAEKKAKEAGDLLGDEASKASGDLFVGTITSLAGGEDGKIVAAAIEVAIKKCPDKAILLLSNGSGKLAVLAVVPKALQEKISAVKWTTCVLDAIGGKGGGSAARAQGQITDASLLDKALAAANAFKP